MRNSIFLLLVLLLIAPLANAGTIEFTGQNNLLGLQASALFVTNGRNLTVTLTNTSANDVLNPSQVLTAVFWSWVGVVPPATLTPVSALLGSGTIVLFGSDNGGNVGGEWAYAQGLSGAPGSTGIGISSSGFCLFGAANFNGANLQGPAAVDGIQYGITSTGDNPSNGNQKVTGSQALIQSTVVFTFTSNSDLDASKITNVSFQYGTALTEPNVPGFPVPEPDFVILLGLSLGAVSLVAWRFRS